MLTPSPAAQAYFDNLEPDRKDSMERLRQLLLANLPEGFQEELQYRMPSYTVSKALYPAGYHCDPALSLPFIAISANKGGISFYHMGMYADPDLLEWFKAQYAAETPKKLDMGKSCLRFKKPEDIPWETLGNLIRKVSPGDWIAQYEKAFRGK